MSINHDIPQVKVYPPVVVTVTIAIGLLMQLLFPLHTFESSFLRGVGFMLVVGSILILWWSDVTFKNVGTPADPLSSTADLVTHGPHAYTRNPVYLAFMLMTFGIGLWVGTVWLLLLDVVQGFILERLVIVPEEHYLSRKFGERYKRYSEKVRRWL